MSSGTVRPERLLMHREQQLELTGERFDPRMPGAIALEHVHRYATAARLAAGLDALDLGSGEGYGARLLSEVARTVVGIDLATDAVRHARQQYRAPNLRFLQGSCSQIPLVSASVDLAVSFETIEHQTEHEAMIDELHRVLRPGGRVLISTPDRLLTATEPENPFHVRELCQAELDALLRRRFSRVSWLRQRVVYASLIAPSGACRSRGFLEFRGDCSGVRASESLADGTYLFAVASDAAIPPLPVSVLDGTHVLAKERRINAWVIEDQERRLRARAADTEG